MKKLNYAVFPSEETTISVKDDTYGGAHEYHVKKSRGFNQGQAEYVEEETVLQFVYKDANQETIAGLQNEQLVYVLKDRIEKLNARFPSPYNEEMLKALDMFLSASRRRVEDRLNRGVMGKIKK